MSWIKQIIRSFRSVFSSSHLIWIVISSTPSLLKCWPNFVSVDIQSDLQLQLQLSSNHRSVDTNWLDQPDRGKSIPHFWTFNDFISTKMDTRSLSNKEAIRANEGSYFVDIPTSYSIFDFSSIAAKSCKKVEEWFARNAQMKFEEQCQLNVQRSRLKKMLSNRLPVSGKPCYLCCELIDYWRGSRFYYQYRFRPRFQHGEVQITPWDRHEWDLRRIHECSQKFIEINFVDFRARIDCVLLLKWSVQRGVWKVFQLKGVLWEIWVVSSPANIILGLL